MYVFLTLFTLLSTENLLLKVLPKSISAIRLCQIALTQCDLDA